MTEENKLLISPTEIQFFLECPAKFWFARRYRGLDTATEQMLLGRAIHEVIAEYYRLIPENLVPDEVELYLNKAIDKVVGFLTNKQRTLLKMFIKFEKKRLSWHISTRPIAIEQKYEKPPFKGIVDAVFRKGDKVVVVDWKSGYLPRTLPDQYVIQGCIYSYLVNADKVIFYFLSNGRYKEVSASDCQKISEKIKEVVEQIKCGVREKKRGSHCRYCQYQLVCKLEELDWFGFKEVIL